MSKKKKDPEPVRGIPKETFTHDPVAFGALMEFQYGLGEDQKEAERLLFEETKGISCKVEELPVVLPNLDFWLSFEEEDKEPKQYRLYMNCRPVSLFGATILRDVGCQFKVVQTNTNTLCCYNKKHSLPILVDLKEGSAHCSLQDVKDFARSFVLHKWGKPEYPCHPYYPYHIDFMNEGWYRDEKGEIQLAEVWCFDGKNQPAFLGKIQDAPYPVSEMLKVHWYVRRVGEKAFPDLVIWDLGLWSDLRQKVNEKGHLIQPDPPVVLFLDEVKTFDDGQKQLIVDDYGCMYCVRYDGYFLINKHLYRIYGRMID